MQDKPAVFFTFFGPPTTPAEPGRLREMIKLGVIRSSNHELAKVVLAGLNMDRRLPWDKAQGLNSWCCRLRLTDGRTVAVTTNIQPPDWKSDDEIFKTCDEFFEKVEADPMLRMLTKEEIVAIRQRVEGVPMTEESFTNEVNQILAQRRAETEAK